MYDYTHNLLKPAQNAHLGHDRALMSLNFMESASIYPL